MPSPAFAVAQYLADSGVGPFAGNGQWCLNVDREPVEPADAITVYDTGGEEPDTDELDILRPTIQVRVRAKSYNEGYAKQEEIRDLLIQPLFPPLVGWQRAEVTMSSDILSVGRDDTDRHVLTANYRLRLYQ